MLSAELGDAMLRMQGPFACRDLDAHLELLSDVVEVVDRFSVLTYMGAV